MGQRSLTFLNKSGLFLYWDNIWEDTVNYKRFLKYSFFLDKFFYLFFIDNLSNTSYFTKKNKKNNNFFLFNTTVKNQVSLFKNQNFYFGKFWFLKYNNWVIFVINVFNSAIIKKERKKKNFLRKKISIFFKLVITNYFHFLNSTSYDFFLKKYIFI